MNVTVHVIAKVRYVIEANTPEAAREALKALESNEFEYGGGSSKGWTLSRVDDKPLLEIVP